MDAAKKQFLKDCAKYIRGEISEVKLSGKEKTVLLFAEALKESRKLYTALQESDSMSGVIPILESKKKATGRLRKVTGFIWPF